MASNFNIINLFVDRLINSFLNKRSDTKSVHQIEVLKSNFCNILIKLIRMRNPDHKFKPTQFYKCHEFPRQNFINIIFIFKEKLALNKFCDSKEYSQFKFNKLYLFSTSTKNKKIQGFLNDKFQQFNID
ncbi:hypothetical protein BpHYR1_008232 [Brachionus plicatilis]|uniref:Uncharacterized protein n=1 Tax=Brachionus plicatilis TaxID=10195 RepID=A0A3M7SPD5_BRAPC|nr:hypothetical protein BpHYR1_008232 [Brachionus plicatilis]